MKRVSASLWCSHMTSSLPVWTSPLPRAPTTATQGRAPLIPTTLISMALFFLCDSSSIFDYDWIFPSWLSDWLDVEKLIMEKPKRSCTPIRKGHFILGTFECLKDSVTVGASVLITFKQESLALNKVAGTPWTLQHIKKGLIINSDDNIVCFLCLLCFYCAVPEPQATSSGFDYQRGGLLGASVFADQALPSCGSAGGNRNLQGANDSAFHTEL